MHLDVQYVCALIWICTLTGWWDRLVGFKQNIGFMAQGEQRVLDKAGRVYPFKDPSQHVLVCTHINPSPLPQGYNSQLFHLCTLVTSVELMNVCTCIS